MCFALTFYTACYEYFNTAMNLLDNRFVILCVTTVCLQTQFEAISSNNFSLLMCSDILMKVIRCA